MTSLATVRLDDVDGALVARVRGEIDLSNVDEIGALVAARLDPTTRGLVLDLTETTYLDSTGVRLLFELAQRLHARRQQLCLVVADAAVVRRVVVLTHLEEQVPIDGDLEAAISALGTD